MSFPSFPNMPAGQKITASLDYDVKKFDWNKYEFSDGLTVRLVSIPLSIYSTNQLDPNGMPVYVIAWNAMIRIVAPEKMLGTPTPPIPPEEINRRPAIIISQLTTSEPWNEYELSDGHTLKERTVATQFKRIKESFDPTGAPMVMVSSQNALNVILTESDER